MTETFKSGQWRICSLCLSSIKPKDRACYLYDEVACMDCLTAEEEKATAEHTRLSEELDAQYEALAIANREEANEDQPEAPEH